MPDINDPVFKAFALKASGYDPEAYDLQADGSVVPKVKQQPSAISDATEPMESGINKPKSTALQAGIHSAEANALPTVAGLGAAASTPLVLGSLGLAPETGGLSLLGLLAPLITGGAAAYGASKLQSKMLPDSVTQQLAQEQQEHPIASGIGAFAPSLPFFNPITGAKNLPGIARAGAKAFSRGMPALTAEEAGGLLSTAANVGIAGGQDIYNQSQSNEPFNWAQLGLNVGGAGLLNTPTALGAKVFSGLHPEGESIATEPMGNNKRRQLSWYGNPSENPIELPMGKTQDIGQAEQDLRNADIEKANQYRQQMEEAGQPISENTIRLMAGKLLPSNISRNEISPDELPITHNANVEKANNQVENESPEDLEARNIEQKLSGNERYKYQEESTIDDNDPRLLANAPESFKRAVYQLAARRGITLKEAAGLAKPSGQEVAGVYKSNTREAVVNPNKAGLDTPIHEVVGHGYIDDLAASTIASDRALAKKGIDIFGGDKAQAEEALASKLGVEGVPRLNDLIHGSAGRQFESWFKDFTARWKNNLGMANDADVVRHLSARSVYDAPRGSRGEIPKARYTGFQSGFGKMEGRRLFTANEDIKDENGTVMIPKDSTVSEDKLRSLGLMKYSEKSELLKPTPLSYNDLSPEDKKAYAKLHTDALTARVDREKLGSEGERSNNLIDSELALKKFESDRGMKYQEESESIKKPLPYGYWISKDGEFKPVDNHGHVRGARNIHIKENNGHITKSDDSIIVDMYRKGWNRAVFDRANNKLQVDGDGPISYSLKDKIKNFAIENGINAEYFNSGIPKSRALNIYNDNAKYQEESALKPQDVKLGSIMSDKSLSSSRKDNDLGYATFRPTRPENDTILAKEGKKAEPFIAGLNKYYNLRDEYTARYVNPLLDALKPLKSEQKDNIERVLVAERRAGISYRDELKTPQEQKAYDSIREIYKKSQQDQINANQPVKRYRNDGTSFQTLPKSYEFFHANQLDPNVIKELQDNPASQKAAAIRDAFVKHYESNGYSKEEGEGVFKGMLDAYDKGASNLAHFRGVSVEQGIGLPDSLMRPGIERNLVRYLKRTANARAFHDAIESQPDVAKSIGYTKDPWGKDLTSAQEPLHSKEVKDILGRIKGEDHNLEESKVKSFNRVATSMFLGPLTNVHIAASSLTNAIAQFKPGELPGVIGHLVTHWSDAAANALKTGYNQKQPTLFRDLLDAHSSQLERVNSLADGISRINGRGMTNDFTKTMLQAMGEYRVKLSVPLANTGDMQAIRLMRHVDPAWVKNKVYTQDEMQQMASNFGRILHGAHDSRTLPSVMLHDTAIQPFLSLASWSVGQTNNFMRHVYTPAIRDGNFTPLIMSTLGAAFGGYIIKNLRETISDKKSPIPSLTEIASSKKGLEGNIPLLAYNFMAMSSFAGFGGILSTVAKNLFDAAYKNPIQGAAFPLDEVISSSLHTMMNATSAIMNSNSAEEYLKVGSKAVADLFKENVQLARIAENWGDEAGVFGKERGRQKTLNAEEGDLRRYKMVSGQPYNDESSLDEANPYFNLKRKSFQRDEDLQDAASKLPDLIHEAVSQSNGNMEVLKNKLKVLKTSSYPSMPNPDNTPMTFWNYVKYLGETQGQDVAAKRVAEYMRNSAIGKARSAMVPSL